MASIAAIGVDLTHIPRIARTLRRFQARFLARAFHHNEIQAFYERWGRISGDDAATRKFDEVPDAALAFIAARWAAKEALHKALVCERVLFPEVEVAARRYTPMSGDIRSATWGGDACYADAMEPPTGVDGVVATRGHSAPTFLFHGAAAEVMRRKGLRAHLSLSHDADYAIAYVIMERMGENLR